MYHFNLRLLTELCLKTCFLPSHLRVTDSGAFFLLNTKSCKDVLFHFLQEENFWRMRVLALLLFSVGTRAMFICYIPETALYLYSADLCISSLERKPEQLDQLEHMFFSFKTTDTFRYPYSFTWRERELWTGLWCAVPSCLWQVEASLQVWKFCTSNPSSNMCYCVCLNQAQRSSLKSGLSWRKLMPCGVLLSGMWRRIIW
jgi:hypothetical protein